MQNKWHLLQTTSTETAEIELNRQSVLNRSFTITKGPAAPKEQHRTPRMEKPESPKKEEKKERPKKPRPVYIYIFPDNKNFS